MTAIHDWWRFREAMRAANTPAEEIARLEQDFPPMEHPLVRTHPVSGEKILFVNPSFTVGIKGMATSESEPFLARLYQETYRPEYQVRFRWEKDSVAFWDNRSTQHRVVADFFPQHRRMVRVTIMGDRPY
jgi:taurine dioxygenase